MKSATKKRLDLLLFERGLAESRAKAQSLILAGQVRIRPASGGELQPLTKPGTSVPENSILEIESLPRFVSRGGEKLAHALAHWRVDVRDRVCLDVGASTGGFTDCLLQAGAKLVYAMDVGHGQIHPKIRGDQRVRCFEKCHVLKWQPPWREGKGEAPDLAAIDVSFISLKKVLPTVMGMFPQERPYSILALVKPQFEAGPKNLKKGIVRDEAVRKSVIAAAASFAASIGLRVEGREPSPIAGAKGNREEWIFLSSETAHK